MTDLRIISTEGTDKILEEATVQSLAERLRGRLVRPGDGGYDEARKVWNGMIDRRPGLIARCAGPADVIGAVRFAREHGLLVSVRGGGHNITGNAVCEGGLMIDLSPMKSVRVDPANRTARAETGLTWGEYNRETQAFGFASTGGVVSTTGIAGLTLGGGLGWLGGKHGLSCDNLLSADVVTADGRLLTASADQNPDLFWGLRGGGGNFGVVTSFEYQLHPVGPVLAGMVVHPMSRAKEVLRFYQDFCRSCPDEMVAAAALMTSHDGDPVAVMVAAYIGDLAAGEKAVASLRKFGPPLADTIASTSYVALNTLFDAAFPYGGVQRYWKSSFLKELGDDMLDIVVARSAKFLSPMSNVLFFHLHGAAARVDRDATAFGLRDDQWDYDVISQWHDPAESAGHIQWTREFWTAVEPFASGQVYVNHLDAEEGTRIKAAYSQHNYDRLVALKNKYDPTNLFRLNQNIKPTV
ncbi:MAG: FAD-binding oxidoreductase [Alphaproteobacteria bacterium]|nr:FAD-binding oxidoreductase [Alphaproteobacteria bacterium]MBV9377175.1 FAD-binding oxidoreductase [Alphaproteobacteria bacterium]